MTLLGAIVIPLSLFCFFFRPQYLLPLLVVSSIFEAGSIFNGQVGQFMFGVAPFYFVEIIIAFRFCGQVLHDKSILPKRENPLRGIAVLLVVFWAWSFCSAFILPNVFRGMPVYLPREGVDVDLANLAPLQWTLSNLAQAGYLTLNVIALLYGLMTIRTVKHLRAVTNAFYAMIFIVVVIGIVQRLVILTNGSFPYEILNNNPGQYHGFDQEIGNFQRITSTFGEPSSAGTFLSAAGVGLLASYLTGRRGLRRLLGILAVIIVLIDTTATTGYAAFGLTFLILLASFNPFKRQNTVSVSSAWFGIIAILGIAGGTLLLIPGLSDAIQAMTVDKLDTFSFIHRVTADFYALLIVKNTYGVGVGLGSNRASSFIMTLLSSVGLVGTILLMNLLWKLAHLFPGKRAPYWLQASFWCLVGLLVGHVIGEPDLNHPVLWAMLIMVTVQLNVWGKWQAPPAPVYSTSPQLDPSVSLGTEIAPAT